MITVMDDSIFKARTHERNGFEFVNGQLVMILWSVYVLSALCLPELELVSFSWASASSFLYVLRRLIPLFRSDYELIFKDSMLVMKDGDAVMWSVSYQDLSHIDKEVVAGTGTVLTPLIEETFIYTHGEDKFLLPNGAFDSYEIEAIQLEITRRIAMS